MKHNFDKSFFFNREVRIKIIINVLNMYFVTNGIVII